MTAVPTWQAWLGAAIQAARQQAELTPMPFGLLL
jgi:hypothetical protein